MIFERDDIRPHTANARDWLQHLLKDRDLIRAIHAGDAQACDRTSGNVSESYFGRNVGLRFRTIVVVIDEANRSSGLV